MKNFNYKQALLTWLWSCIAFAAVFFIYLIAEVPPNSFLSFCKKIMSSVFAFFYGAMLSVPALMIMIIFNYLYFKVNKATLHYKYPYIYLLILMNVAYLTFTYFYADSPVKLITTAFILNALTVMPALLFGNKKISNALV